jgi:hypothetical protein
MNNRLTDSDRLWQVLMFLIPREIISRSEGGWVELVVQDPGGMSTDFYDVSEGRN